MKKKEKKCNKGGIIKFHSCEMLQGKSYILLIFLFLKKEKEKKSENPE